MEARKACIRMKARNAHKRGSHVRSKGVRAGRNLWHVGTSCK